MFHFHGEFLDEDGVDEDVVDEDAVDEDAVHEDVVDFSPRLTNDYHLKTSYSTTPISIELVDFIDFI